MKVDLEQAHKLTDMIRSAAELYRRLCNMLLELGTFCDVCGETDPPSLFYPLEIHGPDSISGFICNDCERELRRNVQSMGPQEVPGAKG